MFSLSLMGRLAGQISTDKRANMKHGGQSWSQPCIHSIPQQCEASALNEILAQVQQLTAPHGKQVRNKLDNNK